jgi:hypothetical protein
MGAALDELMRDHVTESLTQRYSGTHLPSAR